MKRGSWMVGIGLLAGTIALADALAQPPPARIRRKAKVDTPREARADKNRDGHVDPAEARFLKRDGYFRNRSDVDRPWEKDADKNNDGKVDAVELRVHHLAKLDANGDGKIDLAERRVYWTKRWRVVDTAVEKKYDKDGDGFLDWAEAREMLKDKLILIETDGKAKVDTDLELEFDTNGDGVIDKSEAPALRAAIEAG